MQAYKTEFIELALSVEALKFGEFTLKSGRISPYFFNAGAFNTGQKLATLGRLYARALHEANPAFDMLFGPAYKGIPLVSSLGIALANEYSQDVPYCFNRKLAKDHGEGGNFVGTPLEGNVFVVDDVITAGTAIRESIGWIEAANAQLAGIIVMLDRQERGQGTQSAIQEIKSTYGVPVISIINLDDLLSYLAEVTEFQTILPAITAYRDQYAV